MPCQLSGSHSRIFRPRLAVVRWASPHNPKHMSNQGHLWPYSRRLLRVISKAEKEIDCVGEQDQPGDSVCQFTDHCRDDQEQHDTENLTSDKSDITFYKNHNQYYGYRFTLYYISHLTCLNNGFMPTLNISLHIYATTTRHTTRHR